MTSTDIHPIQVADDEKTASIMIYAHQAIFWGDVVIKKAIRASTWLRTNAAPEVVQLLNARSLLTLFPGTPRPTFSKELLIFTNQILAYHLVPPQQDPPDYDETEPNRSMFPVTARVGTFRFDGYMRLSSISSPFKYLTLTREAFTGLYNLEITNPVIPELGVFKVPFALVGQEQVIYTIKS
jgi:hypothetical protein